MVYDSLTNPFKIFLLLSLVNLNNLSFGNFFVVRKHVSHVPNLL